MTGKPNTDTNIINWFWLIILVIVLVFIPIFVCAKEIKLIGESYTLWTGAEIIVDLFSYRRSQLIIWSGIIGSVMIVLYFIENKIKIGKINIQVATTVGFVFLTIISTIYSKYHYISIWGANLRYEGASVLISYIIIFWMAYFFIKHKKHVVFLYHIILLSSFCVILIGFLQLLGVNFYNLNWVEYIIRFFEKTDFNINLNDTSINPIFSTLFNANYYGVYLTLVSPLFLSFFLLSKTNKSKLLSAVILFIMWVTVFGSQSRTAILGCLVGELILVYLIGILKKRYLMTLFTFIIIILSFISVLLISGENFMNKIYKINPVHEKMEVKTKRAELEKITFNGNEITIIVDDNVIKLKWLNDEFSVNDKLNNAYTLKYSKEEMRWTIVQIGDSKYSFSRVYINNDVLVNLKLNNIVMNLFGNNDGLFLIGSRYQLYDYEVTSEKIGFEKFQEFASYRGYIWSRTLPLIKKTLLVGNGPDTFVAFFPQEDWTDRLNSFEKVTIIDKPHSFFLQTAHNTGLLSLIILLLLFINFIFRSVFLLYKNNGSEFSRECIAIVMTCVICYLFSCLFNDSVVFVAPIFWIILGTGYAVFNFNNVQ
ncbi:O-antigen ligase family protein [Fusibacter bizertensis]